MGWLHLPAVICPRLLQSADHLPRVELSDAPAKLKDLQAVLIVLTVLTVLSVLTALIFVPHNWLRVNTLQ